MCFTGKDRVCDTTYKIDTTTKGDYQCTNVETPNCYMEEKVINDVTCTNTVEFTCSRVKSTKNDGYGQKGVDCKKEDKQDCYNSPKKAKKYSYTKDCKEQPREICDQCEKKTLKSECGTQERLECIYKPVKECREDPKEYCHKVEKVVVEEVCDMKF